MPSPPLRSRPDVRLGHPLGEVLAVLVLALGLTSLAGCAEGGSSGADGAPTGSVAVLLTDAPIDDFVAAWVTVTRISLIGGDEADRVVLFEGEETFDLLALQNVSEPFAIADDVPAGRYTKIRLEVDRIELERRLPEGGTETVEARVLANGRVDLNPRGGFEVEPGGMLAVRLDVDARRSIQVVETGSGEILFRPQVFVDVLDADVPGRLIYVDGTIEAVERSDDGARVLLCDVAIQRRTDGTRFDRDCVRIAIDAQSVIFDASGLPCSVDELAVGEPLAVFGRLAEVERDDRLRLRLLAEVVELGGSGAFLRLTGVTDREPVDGPLSLDLDPGQGFADPSRLDLVLFDETRVFARNGDALERDALEPPARVEADGVLLLSGSEPDALRVAIVFVEEETADPATR